MPIQKGTARITLANEGSIIQLSDISPKQQREYFKQEFKLADRPRHIESLERKPKDVGNKETYAQEGSGNMKYTPKEDELVRVPFRLLSATVVAAFTWRATDFTDVKVLKKSVPLLIGKTAFTDHWQYSDNQIGVIETAVWDEGGTKSGGVSVPPGINGVYLIDGAMNEKLVRSLLGKPPSIYSNSVTIDFEWESTHDYEDEDTFFRNVGIVQSDGKMCARKATKILDYYESSILWMGADPFAKMLDEQGQPINVDKSSVFDQASKFEKLSWENQKKYFASCSFKKDGISLRAYFENKPEPPKPMEKEFEEFLKKVRAALKLADNAEVTTEHLAKIMVVTTDEHTGFAQLKKEHGEFKTKVDGISAKDEEIAQLKKDKGELQTKVEGQKEMYDFGVSQFDAKKEECIRLYKLKAGDKASEAIVTLIKEAKDGKVLEALLNEHVQGASEKFKATCKKCHSTDFEFKSTFSSPENEPGKAKPDEQFRDEFRESI